MLQNAYFLAKIGADTAENEQHFAEILPGTWRAAAARSLDQVAARLGDPGLKAWRAGLERRRHPGAVDVRCNAYANFVVHVALTSNVTIVRHVQNIFISKPQFDTKILEIPWNSHQNACRNLLVSPMNSLSLVQCRLLNNIRKARMATRIQPQRKYVSISSTVTSLSFRDDVFASDMTWYSHV